MGGRKGQRNGDIVKRRQIMVFFSHPSGGLIVTIWEVAGNPRESGRNVTRLPESRGSPTPTWTISAHRHRPSSNLSTRAI